MGDLAADTRAAVRRYPRPGLAVRQVVLHEHRDGGGTQLEVANPEADGTLRIADTPLAQIGRTKPLLGDHQLVLLGYDPTIPTASTPTTSGRVPRSCLGHVWGMNQGTAGDNSGSQRAVVIWP
jgi:hypothetical protein